MCKKLIILCLFLGITFQASAIMPVKVPLEKKWELSGFHQPESIIYDAQRKILYVSNVWGNPPDKDGQGSISKISLDGKMIQDNWITGLNAPKGLALVGDKLYVADLDTLIEIDVTQGKITKRYVIPQSKFFNDVASDSQGRVFVSDMMDDKIYILEKGQFSVWLSDSKLENPNGLFVEGDTLYVASWGKMTEGFKTQVPGHLKKVSLTTKQIESIGMGYPIGNLDGLESYNNGFLVTDWIVSKLFFIEKTGPSSVILNLPSGAADLEVIPDQKIIFIPLMHDNKIVAYSIL